MFIEIKNKYMQSNEEMFEVLNYPLNPKFMLISAQKR